MTRDQIILAAGALLMAALFGFGFAATAWIVGAAITAFAIWRGL